PQRPLHAFPTRRSSDLTAKATGQQPILLIEDEPSVIAFLRAALERKGYAVVDAASGAEGLQRLSNGQFAGVISDIRMPGTVNGRSEEHTSELQSPDHLV